MTHTTRQEPVVVDESKTRLECLVAIMILADRQTRDSTSTRPNPNHLLDDPMIWFQLPTAG